MSRLDKTFLVIAALLLASAALLSAYGFHGLADELTEADRLSWRWAVQMQSYHAFGIIVVTLLAMQTGPTKFYLYELARTLFVIGIVIFSGSIYTEKLGVAALGEYAPIGGSCFMLGWAVVAAGVALKK